MKKLYTLFTIALLTLLVGCGNTPKTPQKEIVYETKVVLLVPPEGFYAQIPLVPPIDKDRYRDMTCPAKENALTDLYIKQNKQLALANQNAAALDAWVVKQKAIQEQKDKDKKK